MKLQVWALLSLGLWSVALSCNPSITSSVPPSTSSVLAVLGSEVHDAGEVSFGHLVRHVFQVHNTTDKPITVDRIVTSCGCSEATIEPEVIRAGEEAAVNVAVEVDSMLGKSVRIMLTSSEVSGLLADLQVIARTDGSDRILIEPAVVSLPNQDGFLSDAISVRCLYRGSERPALSWEAPAWLNVDIQEEYFDEVGEGLYQKSFNVRISADNAAVARDGELRFASSIQRLGSASVEVRIVAPSALQINPASVFLGAGIKGSIQREVRITSPSSNVKVDRIHCADERITWELIRDEKDYLLNITFDGDTEVQDPDQSRSISTSIDIFPEGGDAGVKLPVTGLLRTKEE